jgi:Uncharacterized protein conserved in bacteria
MIMLKFLRMPEMRVKLAAPVYATILLFAGSAAAVADPADEFFRGRQLTLYIGGGAGGAVDLHARLRARPIARYLPGSPVVVPRNLPAAGGVQAFNALGTTAARDGSAFATSARGPLTDPLFADKIASYDVTKFNWIGAMNDDSTVCYTRGPSSVKTLADARRQETTMASTGVLGESSKFPIALNATIRTKFKVITGYSGTGNTLLAVERGESEGRCTTISSINATQPGALQQRSVNVLVQVGLSKRPDLTDVPLALEEAKTDEDRAFLKLLVAPLAIASAFALPAEVPPDRVEVWRKAFTATLKDPHFREEAAAISLEITERSGPEVEKIIHTIYATPKPILERAQAVFGMTK